MGAGFGVGWRQVGACFLMLAGVGFIASGYSILAVPLSEEFKPSRMVLMLAMTLLSGVAALLSPSLGGLMDRVPLRRMVLVGVALLVSGYMALSFATSFLQVLVIFGLLIAPANVLMGPMAATVLLSRWFVRRRGTAVGIAISGVAMGTVIYPPIVQYLLDHHDWREAFRLLALVLLIGTVPAALMMVNSPADRGLHPDGAATDLAAGRAEGEAPPISARAILSDPVFWLICAIFAVVTAGMKGMVTNLAPLALDQGVKASDAALLISLYGACGFCGKLSFAAIADRLSPRTLIVASLIGFSAGMACLTQAANGYWTIALGVGMVGLFGGMMVPMQSLLVPQIFGQRVVGRAMGLIATVTLCALLSTPPLFGLIFDLTGSYQAIFLTFALLAGAMLLAVPYVRLHPRAVVAEAETLQRA